MCAFVEGGFQVFYVELKKKEKRLKTTILFQNIPK